MQHPASDSRAEAPRAPAHLPADHPAAGHLAAERLAALADEAPTADEAAHLAACAACRREREAYVALVALARAEGTGDEAAALDADRGAGPESDAAWSALAATLRAEGLTGPAREAPGPTAAPAFGVERVERVERGLAWAGQGGAGGRRWTPRGAARLAAALALLVGAAAAGRWSATRGPLAVAGGGADAGYASGGESAGAAGVAFASADEARATLTRAQRDYARAAAFLATAGPAANGPATNGSADGRDAELLRARLATLDALLPGVRAAAREAPEDPAVNQLYLAAYDARETALRQLGRSLPAGVALTGY